MNPAEFAANTTLFGVGGWALENAIYGPRFSTMFGGAKVPILPIYAAGGATLLLTRPFLGKLPWILRAPIYGALLSGVEFLGCQFDRRVLGSCSWDYSNAACAKTFEGCIDVNHGIVWAALGVIVDGIGWIIDRATRTTELKGQRHGHRRNTWASARRETNQTARRHDRHLLRGRTYRRTDVLGESRTRARSRSRRLAAANR